MKFVPQNGILVPDHLPDEIGFGCPKCDDHELVPTRLAGGNPKIAQFLKKHDACGDLEALEKKNGRLMVKGIKQG